MFFSIILLLVSAKDRSHYMNGYFNGRSANVAVIGDLKQGENNLVLFSDNVKSKILNIFPTLEKKKLQNYF